MSKVTANADLIGRGIDAIDTPALVVDLPRLTANLEIMANYFAARGCQIRPHFKSHKCVELARRQLSAGNASGITCAKLSEAEQLVAGGVVDVLIANQVVGNGKAQRLAQLNRVAIVRCAVDSEVNLDQLDTAAGQAGVIIPVLVEVDIGMNRCGVPPGKAALALARQVVQHVNLRFDGLQGYEGHLINLPDADERRRLTLDAMAPLVETRELIEQAGLPVTIVSGGSSATYDITGRIPGVDEIQCGSYALMDSTYARLRPEFQIARTVLATVISARDGFAVVDVGLKGLGCEFGPPTVQENSLATARYVAEEHVPFDHFAAAVGQRVRIVPSHGCTTNSLYDQMWIVMDDTIVDVWAIEGAGCLS